MSQRAEDVSRRLINDYGFKRNDSSGWLNYGRCPNCNKKELFTNSNNPWVIRCSRENNCSTELQAKELYPDLWESFNKRHKPTKQNKNATADAYMAEARGFNLSKIAGWYEQGEFYHHHLEGNGTYTVRFYLDKARTIYMERFVEEVTLKDPETGGITKRKQSFKNKWRGLWWQPPSLKIEEGDTIWLAEACMDAIALNLNGIKAVATLSSGSYPEQLIEKYKDKKITWVWALDNDKSGIQNTLKHAKRLATEKQIVKAAQVKADTKVDWNDLHQAKKLTSNYITDYLHYGAILLAKTPTKKATLIHTKTSRGKFYFEFNHCLWWFKVDYQKYSKQLDIYEKEDKNKDDDEKRSPDEIKALALREAGALYEIANCAVKFLYFQANLLTDESWYYCQITFPHTGQPVKNTFTGAQIAGGGQFKQRLLSIAPGALFTGDGEQLDEILKHQTHGLKTVQTTDFVGYSIEHGCYVFNDVAIKDGQLYKLNAEDYFDMQKLSIKSLSKSVKLNINTNREQYRDDWFPMLLRCFGYKGIIALAYWTGSLFCEQIRKKHKCYPFLEVIGEAGAGKSTLIEFLWRLLGRDNQEGFDPSKSSPAGRARSFAQVAGMPVVLIESDRGDDASKNKRFDWEETKPLFDGRGIYTRGVKTSGNETYEPPFRAALVISQNAEVNGTTAVLSRIIHLKFTLEHHTPESKLVSDQMNMLTVEELSGFLIRALESEQRFIDVFDQRFKEYEKKLLAMDEIKMVRIATTHAQIMALVDCLSLITPMTKEQRGLAKETVIELAKARQLAINDDHPIVQQFWETYDYLHLNKCGEEILNHAKSDKEIAINLNHFYELAIEAKQQLPPPADLKRYLKGSRTRKFKDSNRSTSSALYESNKYRSQTAKCWVFECNELK